MYSRTTVLVVGAGPSGLTIAAILAQQGVDVVIIDKKRGVAQQSRAAIIHVRTLELLDKLGLAEEITREGLHINNVQVRAAGKMVAGFPLVAQDAASTTPFPFAVSLEQYRTEELLIAKLDSLGVKVAWETEFVSYDASARTATVQRKDGSTQSVTADWLIGADGASSTVRQTLGLGFSGKTYNVTGFLADVELGQETIQKPRSNSLHLNLVNGGFVGMLELSSGQYRLFGAVPPEMAAKTSQKQPSHEAYASIPLNEIQHWFDNYFSVKATIQQAAWSSLFRIHSRIADRYRVDRTFLVGDAAHIHSPAGGQGMNLGIGDSFNLGWKLAAVITHALPETVLESYEAERRPIAETVLRYTDRGFMLEASKNPIGYWMKTHVVPRLLGLVMNRKNVQRAIFKLFSQTWIAYPASSITGGKKIGPLMPGHRLPFIRDQETDTYTLTRSLQHTLLVFSGKAAAQNSLDREIETTLKDKALSVRIAHVPGNSSLSCFALVRPDGYIAYVGPADVQRLQRFLKAYCKANY